MPIRRLTVPTFQVLSELASQLGGERYGLELCKATGLSSGTLYPILARLEGDGWVTSRWEEPEHQEAEHRPRRRYYSLTSDGAVGLRDLVGRRTSLTMRFNHRGVIA
jgi:PadR family transcriptional regulator